MPNPPIRRALAGTVLTFMLAPPLVLAQQPDAAQMEKLMKSAQEMQACLQRVDPKVLASLQQKSMAVGEALSALCAAGKRDEAQQRALDHAREMAASGVADALSACGDMATELMAGLPTPPPAAGNEDAGNRHVCDGFE